MDLFDSLLVSYQDWAHASNIRLMQSIDLSLETRNSTSTDPRSSQTTHLFLYARLLILTHIYRLLQ